MPTDDKRPTTQALHITRAADHDIDVTRLSSAIHVLDNAFRPEEVLVTPRIGISKAADLPLRFVAVDGAHKTKR